MERGSWMFKQKPLYILAPPLPLQSGPLELAERLPPGLKSPESLELLIFTHKPFRIESRGPAEEGTVKKLHKGDQERMFRVGMKKGLWL